MPGAGRGKYSDAQLAGEWSMRSGVGPEFRQETDKIRVYVLGFGFGLCVVLGLVPTPPRVQSWCGVAYWPKPSPNAT